MENGSLNTDLMRVTLEAAVPLWIQRVRERGREDFAATINRRMAETNDVIGEVGENLIFAGGPKGAAARGFNAVAEALAYLSFAPGGVAFLGVRWESSWDSLDA